MISFECDYQEGCHPRILERLAQSNFEQSPGYGVDSYCTAAADKIEELCGGIDAGVHFLVGGTQTNRALISAALKPYQGVVAVDTGHISCHETGAIEASGHKVLALPSENGLLSPMALRECLKEHFENPIREHSVQPGMAYISHPAENGALYSRSALLELHEICREYGQYLFLDGARLGYGLTSPKNELELCEIASCCDAFYIGGTKCGMLFGEALVITNKELNHEFRYHIKQNGAMLAKGRLLGLQFMALLEDGLYFDICRAAVEKALRIKQAFADRGIELFSDSFTNQQFPILDEKQIAQLSKSYAFEEWAKISPHKTAVRFCTSWATTDEAVDSLICDIASI